MGSSSIDVRCAVFFLNLSPLSNTSASSRCVSSILANIVSTFFPHSQKSLESRVQLDQLLSFLALICLGIRPITSLSLSLRPLSFLAGPSSPLIIFFVSQFLRRRRGVIAVAIPSFPSLLHLAVRPFAGAFLPVHPFRSLSCRPHPLFPVILIF